MNIGMLHFSYPPRIGGVERVIGEMTRVLQERGHTVEWLQASDLERAREFELLFAHNLFTMPFAIEWTAALWKLASGPAAPRMVSWIHDIAADNPDYAQINYTQHPWSLLAQAHPCVTHVTVSARRQDQYERLTGVRPDWIPLGTPLLEAFSPTPSIANLCQDHRILERFPVLLTPARMVRRKNLELGLRLLPELRRRGLDPLWLVTGPPDLHNADSAAYAAELSHLRAQLGLASSALFLHEVFRVETPDLYALYRIADALFFPSRQEGFGLPIIEAPLQRVPVFCSNIEPLRSLAPDGAMVFEPDMDPAALAQEMCACLTAPGAIQSRRHVLAGHGWDGVYEKYLLPLLNPKPGPRNL